MCVFLFVCFCVYVFVISDSNGRSEVLFALEQPSTQLGECYDWSVEQRDVRRRHYRCRRPKDPSAQSRVVRLQQLLSSKTAVWCTCYPCLFFILLKSVTCNNALELVYLNTLQICNCQRTMLYIIWYSFPFFQCRTYIFRSYWNPFQIIFSMVLYSIRRTMLSIFKT